jgi:hypothetical protein
VKNHLLDWCDLENGLPPFVGSEKLARMDLERLSKSKASDSFGVTVIGIGACEMNHPIIASFETLSKSLKAGLLMARFVVMSCSCSLTISPRKSTSKKLFDLVLRLRKIEMEGDLFIHLVHVLGTQMIWSGAADGLS